MKLIYKLFAVAASILALSSCVESAIEPMTGKYEKPVVYEMNTLASQSVEKGDKYRTFTVELSGDNASMTLKMVSDKYFLADGSYCQGKEEHLYRRQRWYNIQQYSC